MISLTTFLVAIAMSTILFVFTKGKRGKLPPGPLSLPVIGSLLSFKPQSFKTFMKLGEQYENMCTIGFGSNQLIILNDIKLIREAMNDPKISGRPFLEVFNLPANGKHGVFHSEGQEWVEQRRFTLRHLRDFGFGKKTMETLIMEDVTEFVSHLKSTEGRPVSDVMRRFNLVVISSLWTIISGKRHNHEGDAIAEILENFTKAKETFGFLSFFLPKLAKLLPGISGFGNFKKVVEMERAHAMTAIKEHQENTPQDGIPRDFMDSYLKEIGATTDPSSSFYKDRGIQSLIAVSLDLFNAGTDTTSTTLTYSILYLAKLQDVQKKLQAELDSVVGRSRQIELADRSSLPYAEATFLEILRYSSIVIVGGVHTTLEDISFHGYNIPKGTWMAANQYFVHHSTKYWDEPSEFKPERFLNEDGKSVKKFDALIPFSVGKRVCPGETLARDEIFLFMTNIFQTFNVKLTESSKNISLEHKAGLTGEPFDFSVTFEERQ